MCVCVLLIQMITRFVVNTARTDSTEIADTLVDDDDGQDKTAAFLVLFKQFLEARQNHPNLESIFELVNEYEQLCADYLEVMFGTTTINTTNTFDDSSVSTHNRSHYHQTGSALPKSMKHVLRRERDTWRLIRILYSDRTKDEEMESINENILEKRLSDRQVIEEFYARDSIVRQMQLVVDWLEQNETDLMKDEQYKDKIQFYSNGTIYWENTLHALKTSQLGNEAESSLLTSIKSESRSDFMMSKHSSTSMVASMDPDAPFRERKNLHSLDREDEVRLMRHIFRYLRAGSLDKGKRLAEDMGYNWLSAILSGWLLQHNSIEEAEEEGGEEENMDSSGRANVLLYNEGNTNRDMWKLMCWMIAEQNYEERSLYERAIFGSLSGNVAEILPLCSTWEDRLWAYFRCSIDVQIENELKQTISPKQYAARKSGIICTQSRSNVDLPSAYWNNLRSPSEIFREVEAASMADKRLFDEEICFHQIQKFVILDDIDATFEVMIEWIRMRHDSGQMLYPNVVRFFVHFILFCREIGLLEVNATREHLAIEILEEYINYLIDQKQIELIAPYVACLPKTHQIASYARLLEFVIDPQQQQLCLDLASKACLDVELITKTVVESIRQQGLSEVTEAAADATTSNTTTTTATSIISPDVSTVGTLAAVASIEDRRKIDALNWLFFNEIQYIELLLQSNCLMRDFVLAGKVDAAKEVFLKLPSDLLLGIDKQWKKLCPQESSPSVEIRNGVQEHICFQAYFQAHESIADWMNLYYKCKPREPKRPISKKFTDKVAYDHQMKNYESELKNWQEMLGKQAIVTATKINAVLLFSQGSEWMKDQEQVATAAEESVTEMQTRREVQLQRLRRFVIPQFVFTLQTILHSSDKMIECQQLINLVASESCRLYQQFTCEQLCELLRKFHETCMVVLNNCPDALGFPIN